LAPMTAAIWSSPLRRAEEFPASFLIRFFRNHGLLQIFDRPQWKTIPGGSRRYVERLAAPLAGSIRLNSPVTRVRREVDGVGVQVRREPPLRFDAVVMAAHAPATLAILDDASPQERAVLSQFPYQANRAVLHTDASLLPRRRRAWASWNFLVLPDEERPAAVTYDLNRLQRLGANAPICVTLNPPAEIPADKTLAETTYHHPLYSAAAIRAQGFHDSVNRDRTYFCGAYWGNGFHEDGVNSALAVCRRFDLDLDELDRCEVVSTKASSATLAAVR
ncbi:MAG: FAD-dependent oxidoreductase, partial [Planctomycetota bacterium]